jgi:hypothetical protein
MRPDIIFDAVNEVVQLRLIEDCRLEGRVLKNRERLLISREQRVVTRTGHYKVQLQIHRGAVPDGVQVAAPTPGLLFDAVGIR